MSSIATSVDESLGMIRIQRTGVIITATLIAAVLFLAAAYHDGILVQLFESGQWRFHLQYPFLIIYILLADNQIYKARNRAVAAYRKLMNLSQEAFDGLVLQAIGANSRRRWITIAFIMVFVMMANRRHIAGNIVFPGTFPVWIDLYWFMSVIVLSILLGWVFFVFQMEARLFSVLQRQPMDIDILDPAGLEPIARWSLSNTVALIGGVALSVFFNLEPDFTLPMSDIVVIIAAILVAVLLFFSSILSTHQLMVEVKERELRIVRDNLETAYQELKDRTRDHRLHDMEALSDSITAWLAYEKRFENAPEWPYTANILYQLFLSTLIPGLAWILQAFLNKFL